jgi:spore germination cell wall hydrolase CwlJ-like protein
MISSISNRYYARVINFTKISLLLLGFFVAMIMLVSVTNAKLEHLRSSKAAQDNVELTMSERTKQLECLTKNIYWEAAGEPFEGKVAVAQVTLNRVDDGRFGKGVCGVVYQKNIIYEKVICQFSWVCEGTHKIKPVYAAMYKESEEVAKKVLLENFRLPSLSNAMYYHATYVQPGWRKQKITQIGQHIFYKD